MKYRQEVLNVILAQLLQEQGLVVAPEQIFKISVKKARKMPDVILDLQGLRLAIEGEYGLNNLAKEKAVKSALGRVEDGIAHVSDRSDASLDFSRVQRGPTPNFSYEGGKHGMVRYFD